MSDKHNTRPAGSVTSWLRHYRKAMRDGTGTNVPCGDCTACCRSNEYIVLQADEVAQFDNVVTNPDGEPSIETLPDGRCPYLDNEGCSVYATRPRNCRDFDCRAMLFCRALPTDRPLIAEALNQWAPGYKTAEDHITGLALRMAARDLHGRGYAVDKAAALAALRTYEQFLPEAREAYRRERAGGGKQ
ncbi:MAG: YkgJ family cysteine cluster protein [Pseudomonadota bacterium]|nr:YkgJ family cysteine cluster protein [Pseudomonadota bacterium]